MDFSKVEELLDHNDSFLLTDRKSLFDALTRVESSGLQLSEKRTAIEVLCIKQRCKRRTFKHKWISGD